MNNIIPQHVINHMKRLEKRYPDKVSIFWSNCGYPNYHFEGLNANVMFWVTTNKVNEVTRSGASTLLNSKVTV